MVLTQRVIQRVIATIACPACEHEEGHAEDCPRKQLDEPLKDKHNCPECRATSSVEINAMDFLECRRCHIQFGRTDGLSEGSIVKKTHMYFRRERDWLPVNVFELKGTGNFPKAEFEAQVRKRLKTALESNSQVQ